jgi:hypothetical protein
MHFGRVDLSIFFGLRQVRDDLAIAEHAHRDRDEADAVGELGDVEAVARHARVHVGADQAQQQAEDDHADGLEQRARGQHHRADQAQHHQREVLGRAELEGQLGQGRREGGQHQRGHAAGEEGAQPGGRERRPGPATLGHLVPVDHRHDRGRFAREVDQDRGGGAAVLRAVVDARQHDQRGHRRQRVGHGQQHRDGGHGPDAGQHPDQRAQQAADEGIGEVLQREGGSEAEGQIVEKFHGAFALSR